MGAKGRKKKGKFIKLFEYGAVSLVILLTRLIPMGLLHVISGFLGRLLYLLVKKRRNIALENLRHVFAGEKTERQIRETALQSFTSFFQTFLEIMKFRYMFAGEDARDQIRAITDGVDVLFQKAKNIHDEAGGCIFVTPHIGNWELLPHVSAMVGIPLVVVARPTDNEYLEKLIYQNRASSGQVIIPKKNAFLVLQKNLNSGKSIGMLPDQSTARGIVVDFLGRKATATPVPAILAITHKRPIVVVACCRKDKNHFEGFVSDPIWSGEYKSEKEEILRLTREINLKMESIIRKYPGQYLWMHNRWKTYKDRKEFMA